MTSSPELTALTIQLELTEFGGSSGIMGNVWFESSDLAFPCQHWPDFAQNVVGSWFAAILDIYRSKHAWNEKELLFMDGSYSVLLSNGNPVTISFLDDGKTQNVLAIELHRFAREVAARQRQILQAASAPSQSGLEECDWLEALIQKSLPQ